MFVTMPFILLLADYWPLGRFQPGRIWHLVSEKIPLFMMSAISCVISVIAQKSGGAMASAELVPFKARIFNAIVSYAKYIVKMAWPHDLAIPYPYPFNELDAIKVCAALILLTAVSFLVIKLAARH